MSEKPRIIITRPQQLKKGGSTPEFVEVPIPTEPITLRFGPGRGTASANVGSAWLMGTFRLLGSPSEFMYQVTKLRLTTSTPNMYFAFTHSRRPGTFDTPYLTSRGDDLTVTNLLEPIYSLLPGTVRFYALGGPGTTSPGKGSAVRYRGYGSVGPTGNPTAVGITLDLYPV